MKKRNDIRRPISVARNIACPRSSFVRRPSVHSNFHRAHLPSWRHLRAALLIFCGAFFCGGIPVGAAQTPLNNSELEYPIKAAFLYKFCLYVDWPANAFSSATSPIVLGVAGPDVVVDELNAAIKDRTVNARRLEVRRIDRHSDPAGIHLLFVARSEADALRAFASKLHNTLLVTEVSDGLDEGAGINFLVKDNKVRFDIALDTTHRQGLQLSAQLLKVAHDVREGGAR